MTATAPWPPARRPTLVPADGLPCIVVTVRDHRTRVGQRGEVTTRACMIPACCPTCHTLGRTTMRGEPRGLTTMIAGKPLWAEHWFNDCGHTDPYGAVVAEAQAFEDARRRGWWVRQAGDDGEVGDDIMRCDRWLMARRMPTGKLCRLVAEVTNSPVPGPVAVTSVTANHVTFAAPGGDVHYRWEPTS